DFGLAKAVATAADASVEAHARFSGTPGFASPEQLHSGSTDGPVDVRSDIYSLGVTLWYLLCGNTPFAGRTLSELREEQRQRLPVEQLSSRKVPAPVIDLLRSMLATDPSARPQSARELSTRLRRCREKMATPHRRRLLELATIVLLVISVLGL